MRNVRKNIATRQVIHIVGEGLTELFYFSHLKKFLGYRYSISPRLFENNSIEKIDKKIKELLNEDVFVICVFDADVSRRSDAENRKMAALKKKYEKNGNVILCDSLQSIEYWFLLHFEDTCRHFLDSAAPTTRKSPSSPPASGWAPPPLPPAASGRKRCGPWAG